MEDKKAHALAEAMAKSIMGKDFVADEKPATEYAYKIIGSNSEYFSCAFGNLAELFKDAEESIGKENLKAGAAIHVGIVEKIDVPEIDVDSLLEDVYQDVINEYDNIAIDYLTDVTKEHKDELSKELNSVFKNWAKKYRYEPDFYIVKDIVDYAFDGEKWKAVVF